MPILIGKLIQYFSIREKFETSGEGDQTIPSFGGLQNAACWRLLLIVWSQVGDN